MLENIPILTLLLIFPLIGAVATFFITKEAKTAKMGSPDILRHSTGPFWPFAVRFLAGEPITYIVPIYRELYLDQPVGHQL